jgi:Flp pilus assembly protein TadD/peroxiredoxin
MREKIVLKQLDLNRSDLNQSEKRRYLPAPDRINLGRREFLLRFCLSVSATILPAGMRGFGLSSLLGPNPTTESTNSEYHLHPHYRMARPLDALLLKTDAGLDDFVSEKYAEEIAVVLAQWTSDLLESPHTLRAIETVLAPTFVGASLVPHESSVVRRIQPVEVRRNGYRAGATLAHDAFLHDLRSALTGFSKLITADFQVTSIEHRQQPGTPSSLQIETTIRYELVGTGAGFHREQRVGSWKIIWERAVSAAASQKASTLRVQHWTALEETWSRSNERCYIDIAYTALGGNTSYASQLLHGSDYWRSVLDGASGIDVYGHNGVCVGDIDGDGFDDLYICQPGGLTNRLFRNKGDGTFEDITEASGVGVLENTACALFVDVDNDGRQDLIVVRATGPMLFLNQGDGKFRQKADAFHFANPPQGTFTGAAVADYDRDGWLDIYFCLYVYYQGADQYKYPTPYYDAENGPSNFMMRNNRDGTFRDVTAKTGLNQNNKRYSFCCAWNDFNRDGWPDLYVVNDFGRKNLYRNNGNGTFTDIAAEAGVEDVGAGMSGCWFDFNNDGVEDLYVADMWTAAGERISMQEEFKKETPAAIRSLYHKHAMGNSLFRADSRKTAAEFTDTTRLAGVGIGRWAWSSDAWDFDHDGLPELYITNGMVSGPSRQDLNSFFWRQVVAHSPDQAKPSRPYEQGWSAINELIRADGTWSGYERNIFYTNNGDGTFSDISGAIGLDFLEDGRAFALADFDQDGRQEIVLKNRNAPQIRLLKNVIHDLPPSIAFRLSGTKSNRDAIGAVVTVETAAGRQVRSLQAGSGFLSQHSKDIFFGLGRATTATDRVRASIRWPSGAVQELRDLPVNHRIWVEEGSEPSRMVPFKATAVPAYTVASAAEIIGHRRELDAMAASSETWLLAPVDAPDFSLPDGGGRMQSLSSLRGKTVLLNLWAASPELCKKDWQTFNRQHRAWSAAGLQLLAVNIDSSLSEEHLRAIVREQHLSFPILRGSEDVAAIYNILYRLLFDRHRDLIIPTSFLISGNGEIVKVYQGPIPINGDHIEQDFRHIPRTTSDRIQKALPFPGVTDAIDFGRNYLSYGSIYFQRGYMDQAAASFRTALRDDPSSAEAMYGIGSVYLDRQKNREARESFERALKLRATYPDTLANSWNNLGLLAAREGSKEEAVSHFQEALKLSPDHSIALDNLGSAYRQLKRWDDARETYECALSVNPNDAEANYGLGMVFAQNDDTARALDSLQKALTLRPVYPEALNNLGILYLRTQRRDQAVASFEECIRVAPAFDRAYLNLARVYTIEGSVEKARAVLLELLKQHPGHELAQQMMQQLGQ